MIGTAFDDCVGGSNFWQYPSKTSLIASPMPKNQKSSATSATRKKHARKAGGGEQLLPLPKEKKDKTEKRGKGKERTVQDMIDDFM